MKEAVIIAGVRTAVGKARRGTLRTTMCVGGGQGAATILENLQN